MKKPQLPQYVLIGGVHYSIRPLTDADADDNVMGRCSTVRYRKIQIRPELSGESAVDTMLHEFLHAANDIYRIKLSHAQIYSLGQVLAEMHNHNQHLTDWIAKTIQSAKPPVKKPRKTAPRTST